MSQNIIEDYHFFGEILKKSGYKVDEGRVLGDVFFNLLDGEIVVIDGKTNLLSNGVAVLLLIKMGLI